MYNDTDMDEMEWNDMNAIIYVYANSKCPQTHHFSQFWSDTDKQQAPLKTKQGERFWWKCNSRMLQMLN